MRKRIKVETDGGTSKKKKFGKWALVVGAVSAAGYALGSTGAGRRLSDAIK